MTTNNPIVEWDTLPSDTQYYDTKLHIALKLENDMVWEWVALRKVWVRSPDYTSWIPLNKYMVKNPNWVEL
jgi:hypothetical protein